MVSYIKTQWVMICCGLANLGISIANVFSGDLGWALAWFVVASLWFVGSRIEYNHQRIEMLDKKAEKYDALCEEVHALYEANKVDRQYADHLNRKIESFITDYQKKEKQK